MQTGFYDGHFYDDFTRLMVHCDSTHAPSYLNEEILNFPAITHGIISPNIYDSAPFANGVGPGNGVDATTDTTKTDLFNSFFLARAPYTFECRLRCVLGFAGSINFWGPNGGSSGFYLRGDNTLRIYNGTFNDIAINAWPTDNAIHHLAIVWNSTVLTFYIDGVSVGSIAAYINISLPDTASTNLIFSGGDVSCLFDELRISNVARYTSNFAPPIYPFGYVPPAPAGVTPMQRTPIIVCNHNRQLPSYGQVQSTH